MQQDTARVWADAVKRATQHNWNALIENMPAYEQPMQALVGARKWEEVVSAQQQISQTWVSQMAAWAQQTVQDAMQTSKEVMQCAASMSPCCVDAMRKKSTAKN